MNRSSKRALVEVLILLGLAAASLVVYMNWVYASIRSNRAQITINTYAVGTEYAGVLTKQFVTVGQAVKPGDALFQLKSDELTSRLASGQVTPAGLTNPLTPDGQITILASKAGTVRKIDSVQGSFVPANQQLATVADAATWGVTGDFTLGKSELGRLTPQAPISIELPSGERIAGRITSITQSTQAGRQVTTVQASLPPQAAGDLSTVGVQVDATITLEPATYYSRLVEYTGTLLDRWL